MSARTYRRLTDAATRKIVKRGVPGFYPDGDNLGLKITPAGVASWVFRFMLAGRAREMGLGPVRHVGLAQARIFAGQARDLKRQGLDPIETRNTKRQGGAVARAKVMIFRQCAEAYITSHRAGWRSPRHAAQWSSTLETYAYPVFGDLPVEVIDVGLVMKVIEPVWSAKPETASRVRGRIEAVLDWAQAHGYRPKGDNPARWKGHISALLPSRAKVAPTRNHPAMPYADIGAFVTELLEGDDTDSRALSFLILTCCRSNEALGAKWDEIDLPARLWTIPAERMKGGREHRVPLSAAAMAILEKQAAARINDFVFAGNTAAGAN